MDQTITEKTPPLPVACNGRRIKYHVLNDLMITESRKRYQGRENNNDQRDG
jgi:hypothetical protein